IFRARRGGRAPSTSLPLPPGTAPGHGTFILAMLRQTFLWLSHRQGMFRFVRKNRLARRFANRFVAGETIDDAVAAVRALNAKGISATLDLLGESVTSAAEARATADHYVELLDRIAAE